ncbi:MAG: EAL domain-containing protein [Erysipelotrichaceae bacterium]|nr:EAL domain-containing protein [Erysipelotrichaceae bacterium]
METISALFNNAALLLGLSVIHELAALLPTKYQHLQKYFSGGSIALICIAIMLNPFTLQSGIIFDTRSVLISVTALVFGLIPTVITVVVAVIVRLLIGGSGTIMGVAVILSSAAIGLIWRHLIFNKTKRNPALSVYIMSLFVHLAMLICMLFLPNEDRFNVVNAITLPVMLIYPFATVLLSLLLMRQQKFKSTQAQLKESEERFKLLFEKAPLGYQSLDVDGNFLDVNQQWCELLGYKKEEVIGKWFGDFLSPENKEAFIQRFPIFKAQGNIHAEFEVLHKNGNPLFLSFEGKIGFDENGSFKQTHCILKDVTAQKTAEAALLESERKYRDIAENMSDIVWQMDLNFQTTYVSPSVEKLLNETPEQHIKRSIEEKFPKRTIEIISKMINEEMENEKKPNVDKNRYRTIEIEHYKADGTIIWIEMSVSFIRDDNKNPIGIQGASRDITQRKKIEEELKETQRRESALLSRLPGMAYKCKYEKDGTMLLVSDGCYDLTGYQPESFINNKDLRFNDIISPEHQELLWQEWQKKVPARLPYKCEYEIVTASNKRKWVLEVGQGIYDENGNVESLEGMILDISDRKEVEDNLRYINEHDRWTDLYNRDYLEAVLARDLKKNDGKKRAVISINLSKVQLLTSNYGFHYTQNLVKKAANSLSKYCDDKKMLFQTYENRFVFYIVDYLNKKELTQFTEKLADVLEDMFATERIGGGIGILEIDQNDNEIDVDQMLRKLLIASERSSTIYDKDFMPCFYDEELEVLVNKERDIRDALAAIASDSESNSELYLQYQPIYDISTNTIISFEALARLKIAEYGIISPIEFIPIAEKTKLIIPIGEQIIVKAFTFLSNLNKHGYEDVGISINISAIQLFTPDFADNILELVKKMAVDPKKIDIEITESVFASDYQEINNIIAKLRTAGLKIAIDDFGTGYSSLAREKELNVDIMKIDKFFIDKLVEEDLNTAITSDIISMAHKLGHYVIAEGVEHKSQANYLKDHNCDMIQGYYISKPLDEEAVIEYLKTRSD